MIRVVKLKDTFFIQRRPVYNNYQRIQMMEFNPSMPFDKLLRQEETLLSFPPGPANRRRGGYFYPYNRYEDILEPGVEADKLVTVRA